MQAANKYSVINIRYYLDNDSLEDGEDKLRQILSSFSCPKNPDVEHFLRDNAIEFTKKNQSVTYIVRAMESGALVGYFTIALKPISVKGETVSNTAKKKLARISELNEDSDTYTMSAYLIAQLAKNYTDNCNKEITGAELIELAWTVIGKLQYMAGGVVAFLEAESHEKLLSFYTANRFQQFDTRKSKGIGEQHELIQLLRLL